MRILSYKLKSRMVKNYFILMKIYLACSILWCQDISRMIPVRYFCYWSKRVLCDLEKTNNLVLTVFMCSPNGSLCYENWSTISYKSDLLSAKTTVSSAWVILVIRTWFTLIPLSIKMASEGMLTRNGNKMHLYCTPFLTNPCLAPCLLSHLQFDFNRAVLCL